MVQSVFQRRTKLWQQKRLESLHNQGLGFRLLDGCWLLRDNGPALEEALLQRVPQHDGSQTDPRQLAHCLTGQWHCRLPQHFLHEEGRDEQRD